MATQTPGKGVYDEKGYDTDLTSSNNKPAAKKEPSDASRQDLAAQESQAPEGAQSSLDNTEASFSKSLDTQPGGGLYRKEKSTASNGTGFVARFGKMTRRRAAVLAVVAALGGGGIYTATIVQGPLRVMNFGQKLQESFNPREQEDSSRMTKVGRYIYHTKNGGGVQNLRLGVFGNKYANRIEANMNKSGFKTAYTSGFGYRSGYIIDLDTINSTELEKHVKRTNGSLDKEATTAELKKALEPAYGVTISEEGGNRLFVDTAATDGRYTNSRAFDKYILRNSGYNWTLTGINSRVTTTKAGQPKLHFIKRADRKINMSIERAYQEWREARKADIKGETSTRGGVRSGDSEDPNATEEEKAATRQETARSAAEGSDFLDEATEAANNRQDPGAIEKFQTSTSARVAGAAAGAVGVACVVKSIDDSADIVKEAEIIKPAKKIAASFIGVGAQGMSGDDMDMQQMQFFARQLDGIDSSGKRTSVTEAEGIRAVDGKSGGIKPSETLTTIPEGSPFAFINQGALGAATGPLCSTGGMIATTIIGVATGGVASAVTGGVAAFVLMPHIMSQVSDWISGEPLNVLPVGADLGNTGKVGSDLLARYQGMDGGGRILSDEETAQYDQLIDQESKAEMNTKSLAYKIFNPTDRRTIAAQVIDTNPVSMKTVSTLISSPVHVYNNLATVTGRLLSPGVGAQQKPTSNIKDAGFSIGELENSKVRNPFKNAEEVTKTITPGHPDYIERAKTCYGVEIDPTTYDVTSFQAGKPTFKDAEKDECKDKSDDFLQFRMFIKDTMVVASASCLEGDKDACALLGVYSNVLASGEDSSSSDASVATGSDVELAKKLLDYLGEGKYKCDNATDCQDLRMMAKGESIKGGVGCIADKLDKKVLQMLIYLIDKGYQIGTYALCRSHSFNAGAHPRGAGIDISSINGKSLADPASKSIALELNEVIFNAPKEIKARQIITAGVGNTDSVDPAFVKYNRVEEGDEGASAVAAFGTGTMHGHDEHIHIGFPY